MTKTLLDVLERIEFDGQVVRRKVFGDQVEFWRNVEGSTQTHAVPASEVEKMYEEATTSGKPAYIKLSEAPDAMGAHSLNCKYDIGTVPTN